MPDQDNWDIAMKNLEDNQQSLINLKAYIDTGHRRRTLPNNATTRIFSQFLLEQANVNKAVMQLLINLDHRKSEDRTPKQESNQ